LRQTAEDRAVRVTALAGGVGAGKFLRGLVRAVPAEDVTVVVNTGDDIRVHGLHVSPDLDSVTYWLGGVADRERGWGRDGESFRATEELRAFEAEGAWFGLGDLDLATHLFRTRLLAEGRTLSEATREVTGHFGIRARVLPMSDDPLTTRVEVVDDAGRSLDLHFQEYWVLRGARDEVKSVRFEGAEQARPAPGVIEAIADAEIVLFCPSNPIVSIDPILAVPGVRDAVGARREGAVAISPIVRGAPVRGMADKLLPVAGVEVSAAGVAEHYAGLLGGFVIDDADRDLLARVLLFCDRARHTDTIMVDDAAAERLARAALDVARGARAD
jgi:LPPG:FO 2-phospho-L-lactate transferase